VLTVGKKSLTLAHGRIGVISDTHGLSRPQAFIALKGCELIIHAGDIGKAEVLVGLKKIAPVLAIRGNNDRELWAKNIPDVLHLCINGVNLRVIHNVHDLDGDPMTAGFPVVISGHSHKPMVTTRDNVLYVNPGSAGPRRFKLPVAIAMLRIGRAAEISAKIIELSVEPVT
jgi:putative phosphoesterase